MILKNNYLQIEKIMSKKLVLKSKNHSFEKEWKYHEYIKMMSEAKKNGDESFVYKNITYIQTIAPSMELSSMSDNKICKKKRKNLKK